MLPGEQEAQEVARRDRIDLRAQAADGVMMDARQQPPVAPLLVVDARQEAAAQDRALAFEGDQRRGRGFRLEPERRGQRGLRDRPKTFEPAAQDLDQRRFRRPRLAGLIGRRGDLRVEPGCRPQGAELVQPLGRNPEARPRRLELGDALLPRQRFEPAAPAGRRARFLDAQAAEPQQRVMQFLGVGRIGPRLGAHPGDRLRIEPAEVRGASRIMPAPRHHRLRPPLLERRVVEIGVGPRRQRFERQRRRAGQIAGDDTDVARFDPGQQPFQPVDVHRLVQAVGDRLVGQRMVGNLALADEVLGAGDLVGEDRGDQVFRLHAQELRRHLLAAAEARQGERHAGDPAPAGGEHRRIEQRLDQDRPDAGGIEVARDVVELEAMRRRQRQHDIVLGRRRLQFEIELAAEALAQRQAPGAIDAAAERRMDDELHAARFVEEAFHDDRVLGRQAAEGRRAGGEIVDELLGGRRADADVLDEPAPDRRSGRIGRQAAPRLRARSRDTEAESSSVRPGASPSQNGMFGGWPLASSTRTAPRSTRWMR